jgi:hypothetical protein
MSKSILRFDIILLNKFPKNLMIELQLKLADHLVKTFRQLG